MEPPCHTGCLSDDSSEKSPQKGRRRRLREMDDGKCSVCLNPAGPHIYYGARACLPCRAFFKRSVEQYHEYICFKEKQCQIAYGGRKACKYCRFMACLRGGMRLSYVLDIPKSVQKSVTSKNNNWELLTQEETKNIQHLAGISRIFDKSKIGVLNNWKMFLQEIIRWILFKKMISQESKTFLEVEMENKTRRFLKKLPFFHKLPEFDKEIILRENVPMGVLFQKCTFFNPNFNLFVQLSALLGKKEADKLQNKLKDYGLCQRKLAENTLTFVDLFAIPLNVDMDRFVRAQSKVSYWPRDCYEYVLLLLIILFEPRHMTQPDTVYNMQTHFSELLFKYLITTSEGENRSKALARFGSGIDCITKCVELHDLFTATSEQHYQFDLDLYMLLEEMPFLC